MNETRSDMVQVKRHPKSPMIAVVAENGARGLLLSENDQWAIAGGGSARDTWFPTWYAFDVRGPGLDFHGVPATLVGSIEAREHMHEREPSKRPCLPYGERTVPWWREQATHAGVENPRFRGPGCGRFPCLCAQLLDRDRGKPFAASCLRDAKARLVAERGCRILPTEPWGKPGPGATGNLRDRYPRYQRLRHDAPLLILRPLTTHPMPSRHPTIPFVSIYR